MSRKQLLTYSSPGELLKWWLEAHNLSQAWLHRIMDRPEKTISEIITGKTRVTVSTALELEKITSIVPEVWLHLQAKFELSSVKRKPFFCSLIS
jgi:HTH-type transcriptional regulator / antitoxin HigA